jgi:hypothetical protein
MAAFPTLPTLNTSSRTLDGGYLSERAQDGTLRVRRLYAAPAVALQLELGPLTSTQLAALTAHYAADRDNSFSYTWGGDATSYTCRYTSAISVRPGVGAWAWYASLSLEGV